VRCCKARAERVKMYYRECIMVHRAANCTVQSAVLYSTVQYCTVQSAVLYCTECSTVQSAKSGPKCLVSLVRLTMISIVQCSSVQCTVYSVQCTVYSALLHCYV